MTPVPATQQAAAEPRDAADSPVEPDRDAESPDAPVLVEEELLIEEVSIDGMCGVY